MSDQAATMLGPAAITYSRGSSPHDNMPRNCAAQDFRDFAAAVLADRQPGKGPGYFACAFDPPVRSATNAAPRRWLGLDLDGGLRNDEFAVLCGVLQRWSGFIYETASSKPDAPRARIVLELDQPAPRADLIRAATAMRARIDAEMIAQRVASPKWDTSCDRPEQPLFLPPVAAWSTHCEGDSICLAEVLADTASATAAKPLQLVAVGGGNLSMLPPAATGPAVIQVDRHQDVLALTGSLARLVHFGGADYESAMAFLRSERARGRWTRTVDDGELRRAFDGEIAACRNGLRDRTREAQHAPPTAVTTTPDGLPRYRGQTGAEILAEPLPEWRVDTLFPMKGVASIYGVSTAGKSFLAWDLGCAIAEGRSWFGYDTKRAPVSYLMLEGEAGKRVRTAPPPCQ
ncbi:MAG: helicase RepA family protein [Xanthomonadaceae bacterium]|nr:helicase RepA family protein [Xanthomonadaceae bacterium]